MSSFAIAFHNLYDELNRNNRLFEARDAAIGDDLLLPFGVLRKQAQERGVTVATSAVLSAEKADAFVFIDMPAQDSPVFRQALASGRPLYLLVLESRLVHPQNYDPDLQRHFAKIFTYDDSVVDGERFIKLNYAFQLPTSIPRELGAKEKLCVMIAGHKVSTNSQELYGERIAAIRWFEAQHPADFDLYGVGWDEIRIPGMPLVSRLNKVGLLKRLLAQKFPSWRGRVARKRDVMGRYRFAFCYENVKDVPGYITEKLFDAFFSGTVPIYRGANNVGDHIPEECFIDQRLFPDMAGLYKYLAGMSDQRYLAYLASIEEYLTSSRAYPFSCEYFASTILREIPRG